MLKAWAYKTADNVSWVEKNGGHVKLFSQVGEHHNVPHYEAIQNYRFDMIDFPTPYGLRGYGYGFFTWLMGLVKQRDIEIEYETIAQWLITDAEGEILGRPNRPGRQDSQRAREPGRCPDDRRFRVPTSR